jgi:hypothetical protein
MDNTYVCQEYNQASKGNESMNILKEWREVAANCPNVLTQKLIRDTADELQHAIKMLAIVPTVEHMKTINALWARGTRYVSVATQIPDPEPPIAGAGRGEIELQRIAA